MLTHTHIPARRPFSTVMTPDDTARSMLWTQAKYAELMGDMTGPELGGQTARGEISPSKYLQPKGNHPVPFPENFRGLSDCHPLSWGNPRTATGHMLRNVERLRTPPTMPPLPKSPRRLRTLDDIRQVRLCGRNILDLSKPLRRGVACWDSAIPLSVVDFTSPDQ